MGNSDNKETVEKSYTKTENERNDRQVASHDETSKKPTCKGQPAMKDYSQKSTQNSFDSQQENKSRRNSICSEYYCWYGHDDCFSEGGKGRYSGGRSRKPRGSIYRPWRKSHRPRGRSHGPAGSRNSWGSGGSWDWGSADSAQYPEWGTAGFGHQQGQHCSQNFEGFGNQARNGYQNYQDSVSADWNFRTNRNEVDSRAHYNNSKNNIGNNSVKQMKKNMYEKVNKAGLKKPKRVKLSIEEIKKLHSLKKTEGAQELAKDIEEKSEIADKVAKIKEVLGSLPSSGIFSPQHQSQDYQQSPEPDSRREEAVESGTQDDALEDEHFALPRNDSMEISEIMKEEVPDIELVSEIKQEFEFEPIDLNEKCEVGYGQDGDGTLDLDVRCVVSGENGQENAGEVDIVEVTKTLSPCIDIACEEATTSSFIAASGSSDPIDSATRLAPVYKKRGRPSKGQGRIIGGHEVVIGTVGDLVSVQENNRSAANIENYVEINLDNETSPDESMEQDNSNKMKSLGIIFEQESRLLSDLVSVDFKMTSLAHDRSSVMRQLLFLSELKSQILK